MGAWVIIPNFDIDDVFGFQSANNMKNNTDFLKSDIFSIDEALKEVARLRLKSGMLIEQSGGSMRFKLLASGDYLFQNSAGDPIVTISPGTNPLINVSSPSDTASTGVGSIHLDGQIRWGGGQSFGRRRGQAGEYSNSAGIRVTRPSDSALAGHIVAVAFNATTGNFAISRINFMIGRVSVTQTTESSKQDPPAASTGINVVFTGTTLIDFNLNTSNLAGGGGTIWFGIQADFGTAQGCTWSNTP